MTARVLHVLALLAVLNGTPLIGARAAADGLTFGLPMRCELGETCWIPNYVDLKPGKGVLDYACGDATYDAAPGAQHKGTDFAVRDMVAVRQGVSVLAVARGQVIGLRDGMRDISVEDAGASSVRGKECGNAVRIKHDHGLITQYCHMRQGSVTVQKGDWVQRGQPLGLVGLSGQTEFPHLHFQVEQDKTVVDPFAGLDRKASCGVGENSLWDAQTLAQLPYQPTAIFNAGFASQKPERESIREGLYRDTRFKPTAAALVVWAELYRVRAADEIVVAITGPSGAKVHAQRIRVEDNKAYYYVFSGLRRKAASWPVGLYRADVALVRGEKTFAVTRQIEVH